MLPPATVSHEPGRVQLSVKTAALVFTALVPIVYTAVAIGVLAVNTPFWDEWGHIRWFVRLAEHNLTLRDLFAQENEYRQFFPNLLFVALGWLSKGDFRLPIAVTFLLVCFISFSVHRLARQTLGEAPSRWLPAFVAANVLIFSPVQYENWLQGQQLIYFVPIACLTSCALIVSSSSLSRLGKFVLCGMLCTISTFSSANGIVCWPLVLPLLISPVSWDTLWKAKWWIGAWVFACALNLGLYLYGYEKPPHHPSLLSAFSDAEDGALYFFTLLGRPLSPAIRKISASIGAIMVAIYALSAIWAWKRRKAGSFTAALPWLVVGGYSICTALLVTIGRAGFGVGQALTPRYTTFTVFLPVALVFLLLLWIGSFGRDRGARAIAPLGRAMPAVMAAAVVIYHVPIYVLGIADMNNFHVRVVTSKACVLLVNVIKDECEKLAGAPQYRHFMRGANALDRLGFLEGSMVKTADMREIASSAGNATANHGFFAELVRKSDHEYVASGEAFLGYPNKPAHLVVLAYEAAGGEHRPFGVARLPDDRDIVSAALGWGRYGDGRWVKPFPAHDLPPGDVRVSAWAFDAYTGKAYQLAGQHVVHNDTALDEKRTR